MREPAPASIHAEPPTPAAAGPRPRPPASRHLLQADTTKPVLTIATTALKATAGPNAANATVTFPNMTATDNVTPEPTITCTGNFVGSPRVFLAKDTTKQTGVFTVSATATTVSCTPRDAAGNAGTTVAFTVTVGCQTGFASTGGVCKGAARL
jgi:hypothetical protein